MATPAQVSYINDLAVAKTKEFKEVKELLVAKEIVSADSKTVMNATTLSDVVNALTDRQASRLIDALIAKEEPVRSRRYADTRMEKAIELMEEIKADIAEWDFDELR